MSRPSLGASREGPRATVPRYLPYELDVRKNVTKRENQRERRATSSSYRNLPRILDIRGGLKAGLWTMSRWLLEDLGVVCEALSGVKKVIKNQTLFLHVCESLLGLILGGGASTMILFLQCQLDVGQIC